MNENNREVGDFKKYKDRTNYQNSLQSLFIGLINQFAEIDLKKRKVKSTVTLPFHCVSQITFCHNDLIFVWNFIEERIQRIYEIELNNNIEKSIANSRIKTNRINFSIQFLEDILFEFGYRFNYQFIRNKNGDISNEIVVGISFNGVLVFDKLAIKQKGTQVNHILTDWLIGNSKVHIEKNNNCLQQVLNG